MVRLVGVEPTRLSATAFEAVVSTNSTTGAGVLRGAHILPIC